MANLIGQTIGSYQIVALLGKGGMAEVYRARQVLGGGIGRDVALKLIDARLAASPEFVARFKREAQTLVSLSNPHILKAFDFGEYGDSVYLVMELLSGGSLTELIRRGALPFDRIATLLDQIGSALDYAHEQGVIHRDLKPQNVLLDGKGNAFLTDFGIAKLATETTALTSTDASIGTPNYMAPEQWANSAIDFRADIYSFGVMLFEMVSGRVPFQGDTPYRLMHMHANEQPPSVTTIRPNAPAAVDRVIQKAMAKNPAARYQTAGALVAAYQNELSLGGKAAGSPAVFGDDTAVLNEATTVGITQPPVPTERAAKQGRGRAAILLPIVVVAVLGGIGLLIGAVSPGTPVVPTATIPATAVPTQVSSEPTSVPTAQVTTQPTSPAAGIGNEVNITSEGSVQASTVYPGFPATLSVDGDVTTSWFSVGPGPNGSPSTYRWTGKQDDFIETITIVSNRQNGNIDYRKGFGFGKVTIQVLNAAGAVVYEETVDLPGTPDPDVIRHPRAVGRSVLLILADHEAQVCGGFAELEIVAKR